MNKIKKIIFLIAFFFISIIPVYAEDKNLVNIYFFHSATCPHCKEENELLKELEETYDNIKIYRYEVYTDNNQELYKKSAKLLKTKARGYPFTIIGNKSFLGFSKENSKEQFTKAIEYYSMYGYKDVVGEYIGNIELPTYEVKDTDPDVNDYINNKGEKKIDTIFGTISTKNLTLPVISILIGLVDGFNPCAMWVLLFLISMLLGMKDRKKMWILGLTFLLTSALIYLLFMITWLNLANILTSVIWVRTLIGIVALIGAIINIRAYIKEKETNGCNVVDDKKRTKIFDKIRKFTSEKNFLLAIIGVITLAASVNIVELACSAGLPVMFIEILSMNNLSIFEEAIYIFLYMFFFLIDDMIVFFIAMRTMELTGFSTKYGKLSKIVGGILLLIIGLLLIFKPEWIMFNF